MSISKRKIVALVSVMLCVICLFTACSSQTIVKDFNSIADVDAKKNTVAACIGTSAMKEAENTFKNAKVMEYNSYIDGIMAVQKGVLQGFALDQTALSYAMATEGIKDIKVLDENVGEANSIVAGVSKNTEFPNLVIEINCNYKKIYANFKAEWSLMRQQKAAWIPVKKFFHLKLHNFQNFIDKRKQMFFTQLTRTDCPHIQFKIPILY